LWPEAQAALPTRLPQVLAAVQAVCLSRQARILASVAKRLLLAQAVRRRPTPSTAFLDLPHAAARTTPSEAAAVEHAILLSLTLLRLVDLAAAALVPIRELKQVAQAYQAKETTAVLVFLLEQEAVAAALVQSAEMQSATSGARAAPA